MTAQRFDGDTALRGRVRVPGDKSISHRALLLAALADGTSTVTGLSGGDDVARTRAIVVALGAVVKGSRVTGGRLRQPVAPLEAGNSGTTIRLVSGLCAAFPWSVVLRGDPSLSRRPMDRVAVPLRLMGARVRGEGPDCRPPLTVEGTALRGIDYEMPVASAQVKGAILLAATRAAGPTVVRERMITRHHTEEMLAACGGDVEVSADRRTITVRPGPLRAHHWRVPGDPSQAAFWVVAACITPGSDLVVDDVYLGPARTGFIDVLQRMGAAVEVEPTGGDTGTVHARYGPLGATEVGGEEVPRLIDEIPVLAVAAAMAEGTTEFRDAAELRLKESDRIAAMVQELSKLGAVVEARPDGLAVTGPTKLHGAPVASHGDHRVAMALAVAALAAHGPTTVHGWECVEISYPGFERVLSACAS